MNVGVALREFLLEGFLVVGELGGGGVGGYSVGVSAVAAGDCLVRVSSGVGGRLVGVSAITADVGAVVVLAAAVLAPAAIPAGDVAATPVIS